MRARAAVFCLHDVVPTERLAEVEPTHRPYALDAGRSFARSSWWPHAAGLRTVIGGTDSRRARADVLRAHLRRRLRASDYERRSRSLRELGCGRRSSSCRRWWDARVRRLGAAPRDGRGRHGDRQPFAHPPVRARARPKRAAARVRRVEADPRGASRRRRAQRFAAARLGAAGISARPRASSATGCSAPAASAWWHPGGRRAGDAAHRGAARAWSRRSSRPSRPGPRALWRMQAVDVAKNAAKACLGIDGWQRLRAPLLAWRGRT